jgi:hypothetical protein
LAIRYSGALIDADLAMKLMLTSHSYACNDLAGDLFLMDAFYYLVFRGAK